MRSAAARKIPGSATPMDNSSLETSSTGNVERHQPGLTSQPIVIVIPAYNEERFIGSVVLKARQFCHHVIVVDDGSSDATAELAALAGAQVIRHAENRGKGAALNSGLHAARQFEPAAVVMLDADGQHSPDEINKLISPVIAGQADLVIGSRYLGNSSQTPRHRIWGHWAFNWLTRLSSGVPSSDSQSGFRAISGQALRLAEVPITIQYRDRPKRNALSHGIMVLNGLLRLMGQYRPLLFFGVLGSGRYLRPQDAACGRLRYDQRIAYHPGKPVADHGFHPSFRAWLVDGHARPDPQSLSTICATAGRSQAMTG